MTMTTAAGTRDERGRFVPGVSGNPAGKKPGTLNQATLWRRAMSEEDELDGRRKLVGLMRDGDFRATTFILKQIDGPPRKVPALALPIAPGSDVATVVGSIKAKMILGEVSPDEALAWFTALEKAVRVVTAQLMDREVDDRMDAASAAAAAAEATDGGAVDAETGAEPAAATPAAGPAPITPSPVAPAGTRQARPAEPRPTEARPAAAHRPPPPSPTRATGPATMSAPTADRSPAPRPRGPAPCNSPAFPGQRRPGPAEHTGNGEAAQAAPLPHSATAANPRGSA